MKTHLVFGIVLLLVPDIVSAQERTRPAPNDRANRPSVTRPVPQRPAPPSRPGDPGAIRPPGNGGPAIQPPRPGPGRPEIQPPRPDRPQPPVRPGHGSNKPRPPHRPGYRPPNFRPIYRPGWHYPSDYSYRRWTIGLLLPRLFLSRNYYFNDYATFGFGPPPYGYRWVRYGPDLLLVQSRTRRIRDVIYNAFR